LFGKENLPPARRVAIVAIREIAIFAQREGLCIQRLKRALEGLQLTRIRIVIDAKSEWEESAPLVGRCVTDMKRRSAWKVQLTSTLLAAIEARYPTFLRLATLAALPAGATTWLYCFIESERHEFSEWDVADLCDMAGLFSENEYKRKAKLKSALEVLKAGEIWVQGRGLAVHRTDAERQSPRPPAPLRVGVLKRFVPVLHSYEFITTKRGKERVRLRRKSPAQSAAGSREGENS